MRYILPSARENNELFFFLHLVFSIIKYKTTMINGKLEFAYLDSTTQKTLYLIFCSRQKGTFSHAHPHILYNFWQFWCCLTSTRIANEIDIRIGSLTLIFHLFSVFPFLKVFFLRYDFIVEEFQCVFRTPRHFCYSGHHTAQIHNRNIHKWIEQSIQNTALSIYLLLLLFLHCSE